MNKQYSSFLCDLLEVPSFCLMVHPALGVRWFECGCGWRLAAGGWRLAAGGERRCTAGGLAIGATVALIGGSFGGTWAFNRPTAILVRGVVSAVFGRDRHTANCTAIPLSSTPFPSW